MGEALIGVPSMRRLAWIDLMRDRITNESRILTFRHLLKNDLGEQIFETVNTHLSQKGAARVGRRPKKPEIHQTKKGIQRCFGMKEHLGVDKDSGLIHPVVTTAANVHDLNLAAELLHGDEGIV